MLPAFNLDASSLRRSFQLLNFRHQEQLDVFSAGVTVHSKTYSNQIAILSLVVSIVLLRALRDPKEGTQRARSHTQWTLRKNVSFLISFDILPAF
jgi:hypothetical protein